MSEILNIKEALLKKNEEEKRKIALSIMYASVDGKRSVVQEKAKQLIRANTRGMRILGWGLEYVGYVKSACQKMNKKMVDSDKFRKRRNLVLFVVFIHFAYKFFDWIFRLT
jgi:hypothetical protein